MTPPNSSPSKVKARNNSLNDYQRRISINPSMAMKAGKHRSAAQCSRLTVDVGLLLLREDAD